MSTIIGLVLLILKINYCAELKCLQVILNDETKSKALEDDCREKLQQRIEMFNNAAAVSFAYNFHVNLLSW